MVLNVIYWMLKVELLRSLTEICESFIGVAILELDNRETFQNPLKWHKIQIWSNFLFYRLLFFERSSIRIPFLAFLLGLYFNISYSSVMVIENDTVRLTFCPGKHAHTQNYHFWIHKAHCYFHPTNWLADKLKAISFVLLWNAFAQKLSSFLLSASWILIIFGDCGLNSEWANWFVCMMSIC